MGASEQAAKLPPPVVPVTDGLIGLAGLAAAWLTAALLDVPTIVSAWLVLLGTALPMLWLERSRSAPICSDTENEPARWAAGVVIALALALAFHAQARPLSLWVLASLVVLPAFAMRAVMERKTWFSGLPVGVTKLLLRNGRPSPDEVRLWCLKAIFIPLYGVSLYFLVRGGLTLRPASASEALLLLVVLAYTVDLSFGLAGYVFASNHLAYTIRSTQPRVLGWLACLVCYAPVFSHWDAFETVVVTEIWWPTLLNPPSSLLLLAGSSVMLILLALYVSATVVFGLRFSNLSNRGVITSGPYRLMKHPAYFAHVGNAWVIVFILMPAAGIDLTAGLMVVPVAFAVFYRLRATTEEKHMREEEAYREYEEWISNHGLVAQLRRLISAATGLTRRRAGAA